MVYLCCLLSVCVHSYGNLPYRSEAAEPADFWKMMNQASGKITPGAAAFDPKLLQKMAYVVTSVGFCFRGRAGSASMTHSLYF